MAIIIKAIYMKKPLLTLAVSILSICSLSAQSLISEFDWNNKTQAATTAKYGKTAKRLGAHMGIVAGGASTSNGLGITPDQNVPIASAPINFVMDGSDFNVDGLEISFEFNAHNTNGNGDLFTRLNQDASKQPVFSLSIKDYKLQVRYTLANGEVVSLKDVATVPTTDALTFYSFRYLPTTGETEVYIGAELVAHHINKSLPLGWVNAGDAVLGYNLYLTSTDMHKSCKTVASKAAFDNFTAASTTDNMLALPLVQFVKLKATASLGQADLSWTTESDDDNYSFAVERSVDGMFYETLSSSQVSTRQENDQTHYIYTDKTPKAGKVHYRVTQFKADGSKLVSNVADVLIPENTVAVSPKMSVYPTLVQNQEVKFDLKGMASNGEVQLTVMSFGGSVIRTKSIAFSQAANGTQLLAAGELQKGVYIVLLTHDNKTYREKLVVR